MIELKHILKQSQIIATTLSNLESPLVKEMVDVLGSSEVGIVQEKIDSIINKDIALQKSSLGLRNQRCYAVKSGCNGLLDVGMDVN